MEWLTQLIGAGASVYQQKKAEKATAKQQQMSFQLERQKLRAQMAQAQADIARAQTGSAPSIIVPGGAPAQAGLQLLGGPVGTVLLIGVGAALLIGVLRPRS